MKIVLCGGGTAGHITPNLALADKLAGEEIYYIGSDGMEREMTKKYVQSGKIRMYCRISASKLRRKLTLANLALPFRLARSVAQSKKWLKQLHADVIFSKGGYVGLPVILAGKMLHIPTVIHESDMSVGLANRISAIFADRFLSTFPINKRAETVGLAVREQLLHGDRERGLRSMGFDGGKPVLLVMGGSLGASALTNAVISDKRLTEQFDVFVLTGKNKQIDCDRVNQREFADNMGDLYAASDVCLTRAGATALTELTLSQVPFVAVPLTKNSRGEQVKNAEWFCNAGCGLMSDEQSDLYAAVKAAYDNRNALRAKQRALRWLNGTDKTAEIIRSCAKGKKQRVCRRG